MHPQGYLNNSNSFFHYNQSAMKMEVHGIKFCAGNSWNIDIRYLFIKDRVEKEELRIVYYPAHLMLLVILTFKKNTGIFVT